MGHRDRPAAAARLVGAGLVLSSVFATTHYALAPWRVRAEESTQFPYANPAMTDFRDTVVLPAQALARGVNPYDMATYTVAYDHAQEFNPYMPWWLSLTRALAKLQWSHSTLVYSCLLALATALCAALAGRLIADRVRSSGARGLWAQRSLWCPGMVLWIWVWRPTSIGQGLGNIGAVAALGALLALLYRNPRWAAVWLAVCWVKPQFGIPVVIVLLVRRQWRTVLGGTLLAVVASLPMVVELSRIAGGLPQLLSTVLNSTSQVGARRGGEPFAGRIDVAGLLEAVGWGIGSLVPMLLGALIVMLAAAVAARWQRRGRPAVATFLVVAAVLVGFPHLHYDLPMIAPLAPWLLVECVVISGCGKAVLVDLGWWLGWGLAVVGLASDHLLPEVFPISRLGGLVLLAGTVVVLFSEVGKRSARELEDGSPGAV